MKMKSLINKLFIKLVLGVAVMFRKRSFREAIARAEEIRKETRQKCLIFFTKGEFKVVTKRQIRDGKRNGYFKGLSYADIEKRALYVK